MFPIDSDEYGYDDCQYHCLDVSDGNDGQRLDLYLSQSNESDDNNLSRSAIKELIEKGLVLVNGLQKKPKYKVCANDRVELYIPPPKTIELNPEKIELKIIHEDSDIIVISKQPGLVVHPASGHFTGTLVHGLLYHCDDLSGINGEIRPGIVHRLDKDTSGVMVVAKNDASHNSLVQQFKDKQVKKTYHAVIKGVLPESTGRISTFIGRHPVNRKKMAVVQHGGKEAITKWKVLRIYNNIYSFIEIGLETGRTHQIRVHMAHMNTPVFGDTVYGGSGKWLKDFGINRQCLHASKIAFQHPSLREKVSFEAPLWDDIDEALKKIEASVT